MSAKFNSPDVQDALQKVEDLQEKIEKLQEIGLPAVKDIPKMLWEKLILPKLLTKRQIAKKILIIQGQLFMPPMTEERAQMIVYGKLYYKNGKLYDNDEKDPNCIAVPGERDNREAFFYFIPPIDLNHPLIDKIKNMIKELKDKLIQLGMKLGEFMVALPQAIITIATSLVALVSSAIILPFGAGLPTAITSVMTMIQTIKDLQAKTADILPLLGIVDIIGLVLPKEAQAVIATFNVIIGVLLTILTLLNTIVGLIDKVTSLLSSKSKKMKEQKFKVKSSAEEKKIEKGESTTLNAGASGGDWDYTYQWYDEDGNVISNEADVEVTPKKTTTYYCKVTSASGEVKTDKVKIKVD